ncbi:hypothetical protein [Singulisphaera acidiphila]|uniref:Uncharacterized protein n=1 Tax=Singulisphaera acidiphila (strain ATCC BAA-1392 / DSM 18658 / VKM B-2454 / MOB10) TaxID=886293 RepID=L0DSA0_SINAD|nr:hypothetical protein [Singulisphaera acidiphila]AGA31286.1 hypothetical protein Sinac_7239 [Singulisphaera acidiphila DSM 18658]
MRETGTTTREQILQHGLAPQLKWTHRKQSLLSTQPRPRSLQVEFQAKGPEEGGVPATHLRLIEQAQAWITHIGESGKSDR